MANKRTDEFGTPTHRRPSRQPYRLWNNARQRARKSGLPFTISLDWVQQRFREGRCSVTGIEFDLSFGKAHARPFGPSLDQIKPGAGYTEENTQVVVWIYNAAKTNGEHEDVMRLARALIDPLKGQSHD